MLFTFELQAISRLGEIESSLFLREWSFAFIVIDVHTKDAIFSVCAATHKSDSSSRRHRHRHRRRLCVVVATLVMNYSENTCNLNRTTNDII